MEKFSMFVPVSVIEKGKKDENGLPEQLLIEGVASNASDPNKFDKDNQWLDVNGYDFTPFLKSGFFNLEHKGREDYTNILGEPTKAYVKNNKFHVEGFLYKDNPKAVAVYQLGQILRKSGSTRRIGYSIEGQALEKDPKDPRRITKARITGCAITISPKNDGTELMFKGGDGGFEYEGDGEFLVDVTDDQGNRFTVDRNLNFEKIEKGGPGSGRHKGFNSMLDYIKRTLEPYAGRESMPKRGGPMWYDHPKTEFSKEDEQELDRHAKERGYHSVRVGHYGRGSGARTKVIIHTKSTAKTHKDFDLDKGEEFSDDFEKGAKGEGSRGGKVIGHTRSGKPIYNSFNHPAHKDFTHADHRDAAWAHSEKAMFLASESDEPNPKYEHHEDARHKHTQAGQEPMTEIRIAKLLMKLKEKGAAGMETRELLALRDFAGLKKAQEVGLGQHMPGQKMTKAQVDEYLISLGYTDAESRGNILTLAERIEKGLRGEGSRGGKVIGRTRSGKPIYDSFNHPAHKRFTHDDHNDAAEKNQQMGTNVNRNQGSGVLAHSYFERARKHKSEWKSKKAAADKEEHFHDGYNYENRRLKGYDVDKKEYVGDNPNEHHLAGIAAAKKHHAQGLSDLPGSAFEEYEQNGK